MFLFGMVYLFFLVGALVETIFILLILMLVAALLEVGGGRILVDFFFLFSLGQKYYQFY